MKPIFAFILALFLAACATEQKSQQQETNADDIQETAAPEMLIKVSLGEGDSFCYVNAAGDTIVAPGRYTFAFSDTITTFGFVMEATEGEQKPMAINTRGEELFEMYWYDNGPDYPADGLFRILKNEKIGYADMAGNIVIEPQFACANPFSEGKAQVTFDCELVPDGEYQRMESDSWFYIDKTGKKLE